MTRRCPSLLPRRGGMALMTLVVALAVLTMVMSATTWQIVAQRRTLERRFNEEQAQCLARAGIERAVGRLIADPAGDAGGLVELIPQSELRVTVRREPGQGHTFQVTSESRFPTDAARPVVRVETRRLRRVVDNGRARIAFLTATEATPEARP